MDLSSSGACRHLVGRVILFLLTTMALSAVLLASTANAAPPATTDPVVGTWNVTYGAPATVTMTLAGRLYTETAKSPVRVTGGSCDLPAGTVIATFTQTGAGTYSGQHGMWWTNNCAFAHWADFAVNLSSDGNTLTGNLAHGSEILTFTKVQNST
ncbi:hypothetical protein ACQI5H_23790 [Mycobacterium heidelbergense]|uniref:hypothetical protein n=1 Tax=Mycobacterium heidelbergense TaxID=53376 RepID=UPI003CF9BF8C